MNKISSRLQVLAGFVNNGDNVVDIGCDHGLLSIYLKKNVNCSKVIASDININALKNAMDNVKKYNVDVEVVLSDGIEKIDLKDINTLIISGMGTGTILHILRDSEKLNNIKKIIIQSNNNHNVLRKYLNDIGYYMSDEQTVLDNGKWYISCLFVKDNRKNSADEVEYGLLNNKEYVIFLIKKLGAILKKIPVTNKNRLNLEKKLLYLEKVINN